MSLANEIEYAIQEIQALQGYDLTMLTNSQLLQIGLLRLGGGGFGFAFNYSSIESDIAYVPYAGSTEEWSYLPNVPCRAVFLVNPNDKEYIIKLVNPSTKPIHLPPLRYVFLPGLSNQNQVLLKRADNANQPLPILVTRFNPSASA